MYFHAKLAAIAIQQRLRIRFDLEGIIIILLFFHFAVVTTTLEQERFRVLEDVGQVEICVSKDLETATGFNVTVQTQSGTAIGI